MNAVALEVARRAALSLWSLPREERASAYVVSLYVADWDDDPARPTVSISVNIEEQVAAAMLRTSDAKEARWNFAFWSQALIDTVGGEDDPIGKAIIDESFAMAGLAREPHDLSDAALTIGEAMTKRFVDACIEAALDLHESGVIRQVFERTIPVLVHELEYYDLIAAQNRRANPPGVADDFCTWIEAMYDDEETG